MATEQDAVNTLLIARGVVPVVDLDIGHPDVVAARNILSRRSQEVQEKDWWFNTENNVQLTRTPENLVRIPAGVLRLDNTAHIILGNLLYDIVNRTTVFEEDPDEMTLIYERTWTDLSPTPYNYIVNLAKEEFIRPLESALLTEKADDDINRSFSLMQISELQNTDPATSINPLVQKWQSKMLQR